MLGSKLHSWKFAADAVWEKALSFDATQPIDTATVERWVVDQPQNVALEAIFAEDGIPATMFGIRITSLSKADQVQRIVSLLARTQVIRTEADFQAIAAEIFPEFVLFAGEPEAMNIGIVSQWYSFGPETIWDRQSRAPLSCNALKQKAPRFFAPTSNPAAIEFWYTKPTDHWYKIYVSAPHGDGYVLDEAKYDYALSRGIYMHKNIFN